MLADALAAATATNARKATAAWIAALYNCVQVSSVYFFCRYSLQLLILLTELSMAPCAFAHMSI